MHHINDNYEKELISKFAIDIVETIFLKRFQKKQILSIIWYYCILRVKCFFWLILFCFYKKTIKPIPQISDTLENLNTHRFKFLIEQIKKLTLEFISEEIKSGKVLSIYVKSFIRLTQCTLCEAGSKMDHDMKIIANLWLKMNRNISFTGNGLLNSNDVRLFCFFVKICDCHAGFPPPPPQHAKSFCLMGHLELGSLFGVTSLGKSLGHFLGSLSSLGCKNQQMVFLYNWSETLGFWDYKCNAWNIVPEWSVLIRKMAQVSLL